MAKKASKLNKNLTTDINIDSYTHTDKKRKNNPPVGLVSAETDGASTKKTYKYDPHIDPQLDWAGKSEHLSFEIDTVSLHVHERIDPYTIIERIKSEDDHKQTSLFDSPSEKLSQKAVIEFYKHEQNWTNRLIAGDSLLVMNSLIEKEGMAGKVQMLYFDPPYGIKYGSNFQPFVNKRNVQDGKDEDLNQEPEMIKAFRDTWELGIHSYLTYLRDRLLLAKELLSSTGSVFVQIGDENIHLVKCLLDEIFGKSNHVNLITFRKTLPLGASGLPGVCDYILWYAKDITKYKFRPIFSKKDWGKDTPYNNLMMADGSWRKMTDLEGTGQVELPRDSKIFRFDKLTSAGYTESCFYNFELNGEIIKPQKQSWRTNQEGMKRLIQNKRVLKNGNLPNYVLLHEDFPLKPIHNLWGDFQGASNPIYVVQTNEMVIQRCLLMSTDPGDLVVDITCGSGTTAITAERMGRRWLTCDTSRVALSLTKQRIITSCYPYYKLANPDEGISSGFQYQQVPHITLKTIAQNEPAPYEYLVDQPITENKKLRVSGPFTVEAVPAPSVKSIEEDEISETIDLSITRSTDILKHIEWKDELLKTGIRGKNNQKIHFSRVETLSGTKHLHAEAETKEEVPMRVAFSFGQEHMPLDQVQVQLALEEATTMIPKPKMVCFCSFHFDPEASKDIDEINWPGVQILKVQMNTDLLTKDLKKKQSSSDSFFFIGSPDILVKRGKDEKFTIEVNGFDYYNVKTGQVDSGDNKRIAIWMLDTDYDGRSLLPTQVFFPMAGPKDGWERLSKNLKASLDEDHLEAFKGTVSLPFTKGKFGRAAVKIVDDRGIESLKIVELK